MQEVQSVLPRVHNNARISVDTTEVAVNEQGRILRLQGDQIACAEKKWAINTLSSNLLTLALFPRPCDGSCCLAPDVYSWTAVN